jgi:hypothetical protein
LKGSKRAPAGRTLRADLAGSPNEISPATPLVRQRAIRGDIDAVIVKPAGKTIEPALLALPAHHAQAGIAAAVDDQPLLAVVHAEGTHAAAAIDLLHPEQSVAIWLHCSSCEDVIPIYPSALISCHFLPGITLENRLLRCHRNLFEFGTNATPSCGTLFVSAVASHYQ